MSPSEAPEGSIAGSPGEVLGQCPWSSLEVQQ